MKLIKVSIMNTEIKVKVGNCLSNGTIVKSGLIQGNHLSPILFDVAFEKVTKEI